MILCGSISGDETYGIRLIDKELTGECSGAGLSCSSFLADAGDYIVSSVEKACIDGVSGGGAASYRRSDLSCTGLVRGLGRGICHISYSEAKHEVYAASYTDGTVDVLLLDQSGGLQRKKRITGPECINAHCTYPLKDGSMLYVCYLGSDCITVYDTVDYFPVKKIAFPKGTGPRHMLFSDDEKIIYVSCELSNMIYSVSASDGTVLDSFDASPGDGSFCALSSVRYGNDGKSIILGSRGKDGFWVFESDESGLIRNPLFTATGEGFLWDVCSLENGSYLAAFFNADFIEKGRAVNGMWIPEKRKNIKKPTCFLNYNRNS